jgi:hypothetical protein
MFRVIKSRTMGWSRPLAQMGVKRNACKISARKPKEIDR